VLTLQQVAEALAAYRGVEVEYALAMIQLAINKQETIAPTARLIADLKRAGYRLFVLSNMSREFIDFLRQQPVYENFEGEVISCEEGVVKPMPEIYDILLDRYNLVPEQTLFIDDREENVEAAQKKGIATFNFNRNDYEGSCEALRAMLL
jgi:HAD superfamily hydrolase (TIGR01509 family)